MQDSYYDSTVEFLQGSLEIVSDNIAYGYETINNLIKEYERDVGGRRDPDGAG